MKKKLMLWTRLLSVFGVLLAMAAPVAAASFVGDRTDFRDESIYFVMTTRFYDGDGTNNTLLGRTGVQSGRPCMARRFQRAY